MEELKGRLELAKFRISKNTLLVPLLFLSLSSLIFAVWFLVEKVLLPQAGVLAVISFGLSMIGTMKINKINKRYQIDIKNIKLKYGIRL